MAAVEKCETPTRGAHYRPNANMGRFLTGIVPFAIHHFFCMLNSLSQSDNRVAPSQHNPMTTTQALSVECFSLLSLREVAELLRVAPVTVYRLVQRRALPVYRIARRICFRREDISRWMAERRTEAIDRS